MQQGLHDVKALLPDTNRKGHMKVLSAFAGIEGFGLGFERAGMTITGQIEWDKNCQKVLDEHYPNKLIGEDICDVAGSAIGRPDLIAGGFPCQEISIAGPSGVGLAGARSGQFYQFTRLVGEYLRIADESRPRWLVLENTDALLTSPRAKKGDPNRPPPGSDMATVIEGLGDLGYGVAYRVVDGNGVGSAQRRLRVVIVGHRGGDPRPAWQVLGDEGPGASAADPRAERRYKRGPKAVERPAEAGEEEVLIWRKSSNPRASLDKGGYETWVPQDYANTLTGFDGGLATRQKHLIVQGGRIRTLTLTEWERLQGFPDGWTASAPDSARYEQLGNAMNVDMATWLGRRIMAVNAALPILPEQRLALTAAQAKREMIRLGMVSK